MGTLGKVLLFVNLLAAGGLTYLASQDWTKRLEVSSTALRYYLTLHGLPVQGKVDGDDVQLELPLSGGVSADTVNKSLLVNHFRGNEGGGEFAGDPNNPPAGQLAELDRVKQKVEAKLAGLGSSAERLAYLTGTLTRGATPAYTPGLLARLAATHEERTAVVQLAGTDAAGADAAVARAKELLDRKFAAAASVDAQKANADAEAVKAAADVVRKAAVGADTAFKKYHADLQAAQQAFEASPKGPADVQAAAAAYQAAAQAREPARVALRKALDDQARQSLEQSSAASRDVGDQRRRIALILSEVDPSAGWQKRVALVVGLRTYREALGEQVDRLRDMTRAVEAQAVSDQAEFTETYLLLRQQAYARTLILEQQRIATADLLAQQAREREATNLRRSQFLTRQADLMAVKKDVAEALARQAEVEAELFALEKKVGDTLRLNFGLEDQLQKAEYRALGK